MRKLGPRPKAEPWTTATPSDSRSSETKSSSVSMTLPEGAVLPIRPCAGRIDVEGALGRRALDALGLVEHRHDEVAATFEDLLVLGNEVLRAVERLDGRPLGDRAGARGLLALDHVHRLDQLLADRPRSRCASRSWHRPWRRRSSSACGRRGAARPRPAWRT